MRDCVRRLLCGVVLSLFKKGEDLKSEIQEINSRSRLWSKI